MSQFQDIPAVMGRASLSRRRFITLLGTVAGTSAVGALAACTPAATPPASAPTSAAPTAPAAAKPTGAPAAPSAIASVSASPSAVAANPATAPAPAAAGNTQTIVQAMGLDVDELDPHYFKSIPGYYAVANLNDMLLDYEHVAQSDGGLYPAADQTANWKFKPWLAQSYDVSPDQTKLTFKLRNDLKFSDGSPLTAKDVKATWDRGVTGKGYANIVTGFMGIKNTEQVVAPDDSTVVITLEKPNPFALKMIPINVMSVMSAASIKAHATTADASGHDWFHNNALGSSAYVLANWTPGVQWELKPNPNYWNKGELKNGGTIVKTIPNASERLNLLLRGDIDIAYDLQPKDMAALKDNKDVRLIQFSVPWPYYMGMNNTLAPFDKTPVRQAVAHAVPYKTIIDKVLYGFGEECKSPVANGMPTSDFSAWKYDTDPSATRQLLQQAGVSDLKFDLAVLQGRPQDEQIAVWIQSGLQQAGVAVNIVKMTDADYYDKYNKKQLQAWIGEFYSWVNDPMYHLFWNFHSKSPIAATGYSNPTVDQLIDDNLYSTDAAKRDQASRQAQKLVVEEAPWALLYQLHYTVAVRNTIQNFNWYPDVGTRFWKVTKG
ncbi:MAG: ABC transporter substrate-binding protein [Chloroflexota bacterium]